MKARPAFLILSILFILSPPGVTPTSAGTRLLSPAVAGPAKHVIIVSMDGAKPAVMRTAKMPNLDRLRRAGSWTYNAQTVLPSVTLNSHASMLSGVVPAKHGVTWNDRFRSARGYLPVPTIFTVARQAGLSCAAFVAKDKLRHLAAPQDCPVFRRPGYTAVPVAAAAATYFAERRPDVMFVHFADPDSAGHANGWGSPQQVRALEDVDRAIGRLLAAVHKAGLERETAVIVTADHGGHGRSHGSDSPEDTTIPWICAGPGVRANHELTGPVRTYDTAATAAALLGLARPAIWDGRPAPILARPVAIRLGK
jgi:predicted AlkP superfamily pyrophosphatase or phosphodiesterase